MNSEEILQFCMQKGLLLDKDLLQILSDFKDINSLKLFIEKIKTNTGQNFITRTLVESNKEKILNVFHNLPSENQQVLEKLKIKLGLNIEISKEITSNCPLSNSLYGNVLLSPSVNTVGKKIEVSNFVTYFKNRFIEMRNLIRERSELENLISINKISGQNFGFSIIGMIREKKITHNKNILLEIEDLTGKIKVLINGNKKELIEKAEEICLDSVVGFKGSGNKEILFVNEIIFPDAALAERKKSNLDESVLFLGDIHYGSKTFLKDSFSRLIDFLNSDNLESKKIKYIFFVGDIVTGIGNYPDQEADLEILSLEDQFSSFANLLKKIPSHIKIIISPGNHDGVRIMEPQPLLDKKYAWSLYELENVFITENPSRINIGSYSGFSGFNVLTYHGFSFFYYVNNVPRLMKLKAANNPEIIMKYLLLNRHLAPTQGSTQYFPLDKDPLIIKEVPDIFISGHTHKSGISYYNNILIVSVSGWESLSPYQIKTGMIPDFCKVPMFNLKTREVKILDFE